MKQSNVNIITELFKTSEQYFFSFFKVFEIIFYLIFTYSIFILSSGCNKSNYKTKKLKILLNLVILNRLITRNFYITIKLSKTISLNHELKN